MFRPLFAGIAAAMALCLALPAQAITDREAARLAEYERFAGDPVQDMPYWRLQGYESLGDEAVVVWTAVNKAWLIKVRPPCTELAWSHSIGLTSSLHKVSAKFDHVLAGRDRCFIASIQPVDYKSLRAERKRLRAEARSTR
ncbi:DUF6491 family protein [Tahibacter amnicola]|uniref:DUF6491 family protein n=1 Tax=Tahibacter amnicola TaxID=2976241 RepID=A0ABY6BLI4_9GAMM|nr:DUF6491 family protein [Tahibacter amnicola]UXI69431.1 DUF6491 family protein [Tahibacter amnicola]